MESGKICFVISPIGDEGTAVRKEADALLWILRSALEKFDFQVIRVDEIARSTVITNEIIQLIQESQLAVIVLTGENPNVFYETGRRHETGKPFIQLIRKDERIPFDVAGIKTIIYDNVESLSEAAKVIAEIQKFIEEFEKSGYGSAGTGISLSTIAATLDRVERKLGTLMSGSLPAASTPAGGVDVDLGFGRNPQDTFLAAVAQGDVQRASKILPRLEQILGTSKELVIAASYLTDLGHEPANELMFNLLENNFDKFIEEISTFRTGFAGIVTFYGFNDREKEGLNRIQTLYDRVLAYPNLDNKNRAFFMNQIQKLTYGAGDYEASLKSMEEILALDPDSVSYTYNASLIYNRLGLKQKALEAIDRLMDQNTQDEDHLSHAIRMYISSDRLEDARKAFAKLNAVNRDQAAILAMNSDIRRALGIR